MRKNEFRSNIRLVAQKKKEGNNRVIDYYLTDHHGNKTLIHTGNYGHGIYDLCKGGIQVNRLLEQKSRNTSVMKLIRHIEEILPDYLGFEAFASVA